MAQKSTFNKDTPVASNVGGGVRTAGGQVTRPTPGPTPTFNANTPVASMQGGGVKLAGGQMAVGTSKSGGTINVPVWNPAPKGDNEKGGGDDRGDGAPSDADYDALGVARGDRGGYERVLNEIRARQAQDESDYMKEVDRTFNSIMDILGQNERYLGEARTAAERQAQADLEANQAMLGTQRSQSLRTLGEQREQGITKREDALAQARRLYQQLQTGAQQRFGGLSGAGMAASEILGEELMRQQGQTGQQFAQFEREIANAETKVNEDYDAGLLALNQSFQQAKAKVQQDFTNAIMQINNMRAATEQERGAARLNALQNVRNQINALNLQQLNFEQQLEAMREQQILNIEQYKQTNTNATTAGSTALGNITTTPTFSSIRALQPGQNLNEPEYVGQIGQYVRGRTPQGLFRYSETPTGPITNWGPGGFLQS